MIWFSVSSRLQLAKFLSYAWRVGVRTPAFFLNIYVYFYFYTCVGKCAKAVNISSEADFGEVVVLYLVSNGLQNEKIVSAASLASFPHT